MLALTGCARAAPPAAAAEGAAFLAKNATPPGVKTTASGLQYKVLTSGPAGGASPSATDDVKVNYEGKLIDGTVFDSSYRARRTGGAQRRPTDPRLDRGAADDAPRRHLDALRARLARLRRRGRRPDPAGSAMVFKIELIDIEH